MNYSFIDDPKLRDALESKRKQSNSIKSGPKLNTEINRIRYYIKLRKIFRYTLLLSVILFFCYKYSKPFNNYFVTIKYILKQWLIAYQIYLKKIKLCSIS